jgi:hypothetical protein
MDFDAVFNRAIQEEGLYGHKMHNIIIVQKHFSVSIVIFITSDPPRLRTGAKLVLKCFSTIAYSLPL